MNRLATIFLLFACSALAQPFTERDIAFLSKPRTPTDWEQRVIANGGAQPSLNTINAMETLRLGCIAAGLTNKIYSLCVFVPDSLEACRTPLFYHKGFTNWGNSNFISGDLNINGLKGDGTTKALDTGVKAKDIQSEPSSATVGFSVIVTESSSNRPEYVMGQQDADGNPLVRLGVSANGATEFNSLTSAGTAVITTNDFGRVGYVSGNRVLDGGVTNKTLYVASPLETHKLLATRQPVGNFDITLTDDTISVFANKQNGTNNSWAVARMSLAMVHDGFIVSESSNFWTLALACRQTLGGGTGDPIHDYNRKVVAAGGANISTTTSNALRTYYSGLNTGGSLYQMVVANLLVPDNLAAAITPVIWRAGLESWTPEHFSVTNLTVNGLTGNGSNKRLLTGINPNTISGGGFSVTSAGISTMVYNAPTLGVADFGGASGSAFFYNRIDAARAYYLCWRATTINTDYLSAPPAITNGWHSGNRTAANAIALYHANSTVPFTMLTNATGTASAPLLNLELYAFAANGIAAFSDHTVSYIGLHSGMTSNQSSNHYNLVAATRVLLGGGSP